MTDRDSEYLPVQDFNVDQDRISPVEWQRRIKEFRSTWTSVVVQESRMSPPSTEFLAGPHFEWMDPNNLPGYIEARLAEMEANGGSEEEHHLRQVVAKSGDSKLTERGKPLLSRRLSSLRDEIHCWGVESMTAFRQIHSAFDRQVYGLNIPRPALPGSLDNFVAALLVRAEQYEGNTPVGEVPQVPRTPSLNGRGHNNHITNRIA